MQFNSPGSQIVGCGMNLISGTSLNGTYQCVLTFPEYSLAGTWTVYDVFVYDNTGGYQGYTAGDLLALGFSTQLQVTSNQDTQPPVLTSFTFSPMAINTTTSSATVTVTAQVTDNLSGVSAVDMQFDSPGSEIVGCGLNLISGTNLNGTYQCVLTFPEYSLAGTWTVYDVFVYDNIDNYQGYTAADLSALGFPTQLQVTSNQDTQPPVLTSFTFSPTSINTTTSSATVTVTAQVTDNLSGVSSVDMQFNSPGNQIVGCGLNLISGTNLNGTYQCVLTFPQYSVPGTWTVYDVFVYDNADNDQGYDASQLTALGFPTQLIVDSSTTVTLASSDSRAPYGQPITFRATVSSSNGNVPTGTVDFNDGSTILGSGTLNSAGVAFFTISTLTEGARTIVAAYLGDANDPAADSPPLTQIVNPASTTSYVSSGQNPSDFGQAVTFTASVSFANGIPPNGDVVEFFDGNTRIGTAALSGGSAFFTTFNLAVGTHQIHVIYAGDANLKPSKSPVIRQVVHSNFSGNRIEEVE
jgi:hypothetical protein